MYTHTFNNLSCVTRTIQEMVREKNNYVTKNKQVSSDVMIVSNRKDVRMRMTYLITSCTL